MNSTKIALATVGLLLAATVTQSALALTMEEIATGQVRAAVSKTKKVKLQGLARKNAAVSVTALTSSGGSQIDSDAVTTDASGDLTVTVDSASAIPSNVVFRVKPQGHLSRLIANVDLASEATENSSVSFVPGDANGDNVIDGQDKIIITQSWGTANSAADINGDGVVNSMDVLSVVANSGQQGE